MNASKLQIYSLALVAANKALSSKVIEATPIEHVPMINGEVSDNVAQYSGGATDAAGAAYNDSVATTITVKATWLPIGGSNRITAPDVRRGELVMLYRFADADEFFWATLKDDMSLRKLETVIFAFSGTTKEGSTPGINNTYFLEISTHNKLIHFHTSNDNGEPYMYDIQINTGTGFIQIQDDDGNFFKFDSVEQQLIMSNKAGSKVEINKAVINLQSTESINLQSNLITQTSITNTVQGQNITVTGTDTRIIGSNSLAFT